MNTNNPKIEILNQHIIRFNFDNGLQVRAFLNDGIVTAAFVRHGRKEITEVRGPMGSDAFVDFLHEQSRLTSKQIHILETPWWNEQKEDWELSGFDLS